MKVNSPEVSKQDACLNLNLRKKMKCKKRAFNLVALVAGILLSGCATIVNDPNIPLTFSFSGGSSGQCTFKNKRGVWSSVIPAQGVMIRRSDDALVYECTTEDGREAVGFVKSEVEGDKMAASVIFWDFGITDSITDKHRTYQGNVVIPVPANRTGQVSDSVSGERVSAIEYYGKAEEEVNTKTYDKNLWAKAFVQAEGDEQKRVAKYIELRANQLYSENVSSISKSNLNEQPVPASAVSGTDISGTYVSYIRGGSSDYFVGDRKLKVTFKQSGNDIIGTNDSQRVILKGTRKGDTIKFEYFMGWSNLTGVWKINPDGTKLEGTWRDSRYDGVWNLAKIE